jgi:hypothetical protein
VVHPRDNGNADVAQGSSGLVALREEASRRDSAAPPPLAD